MKSSLLPISLCALLTTGLVQSAHAQVPFTNQITSLPTAGSERFMRVTVTDATTTDDGDQLDITNATGATNQFIPDIVGRHISDNRESLIIQGSIGLKNDQPHDADGILRPLVAIDGRVTDDRGTNQPVQNRSLFEVRNLGYTNPMLQVLAQGDVYARGNFIANMVWTVSDQRLKTNIEPVKDALDMVRHLQADYYTFKREEHKDMLLPEGRTTGFMAQELAKVIPEAVKLDKDGFYKVNYNAVVPVLAEAIKQLDAKTADTQLLTQALQAQQAKLTALEAQLTELRALVEQAGRPATQPNGLGIKAVGLEQNAPNPFTASTRIAYTLPANTGSSALTISDMQGRVVKTIDHLAEGHQVVELNGGSLAAGAYTYTLSVEGKPLVSKRMILTR